MKKDEQFSQEHVSYSGQQLNSKQSFNLRYDFNVDPKSLIKQRKQRLVVKNFVARYE